MFAGFTTRNNFGSTSGHFPTRNLGQLGNFNVYASNFISVVGITNETQQAAINSLVSDLVSNSLWDKMIAIYPMIGGSAETHKWNLKDPRDDDTAYRLTFNGGWTHSSTGALPNGTNGYANTYLNALSILPSTNLHLSFYSRTSTPVGTTFEVQCDNTTGFVQLAPGRNMASGGNVVGGGVVNFTTTNTALGYWIHSKTDNSTRFGFRNGVLASVVTTTLNTTAYANLNLFISCRNSNGTLTGYSSKECAFITIGQGLSQAECATLYTIIQNFQTTLGRQV
jgi:hypothetical protein